MVGWDSILWLLAAVIITVIGQREGEHAAATQGRAQHVGEPGQAAPNGTPNGTCPRAAVRIVNQSRGTTLASRVAIATSFWARAIGLMGRRHLPNDFGLVIRPCCGVHLLFVFMALDVLHVDRDGRVLRIVSLKPWQVGPIVHESRWAVELPAGTVARTMTRLGDTIALVESKAVEASR